MAGNLFQVEWKFHFMSDIFIIITIIGEQKLENVGTVKCLFVGIIIGPL